MLLVIAILAGLFAFVVSVLVYMTLMKYEGIHAILTKPTATLAGVAALIAILEVEYLLLSEFYLGPEVRCVMKISLLVPVLCSVIILLTTAE